MQFDRLLIVAAVSCLLTYLSRFIALKLKIVDAPSSLKIHEHDTPRFGGFAIFGALCLGVFMLNSQYHQFLIGATVMWAVGAIDDRWTLGSLQKLTGQAVAGSILGYQLFTADPGALGLTYGILGFLLAVVFANAVNLVDGMNGLAGGNSFLIFIGFGLLQLLHGESTDLSLVIAAAILGFLPFNFPIARLFMGDSGSLLLGFLMGYVLVHLLIVSPVLFVCGLIISIVPVYDLVLGVLRRALAGRPIFGADRGHFYDRLNERTNNTTVTVLVTYASTAAFITIGLGLSFANLAIALAGFFIIAVMLLVFSRSLGWLQTIESGGT